MLEFNKLIACSRALLRMFCTLIRQSDMAYYLPLKGTYGTYLSTLRGIDSR